VTIAKRPSVWAGMAKDMQVIWVGREREYFCDGDWTTQITLIRFNKTAFFAQNAGADGKSGADGLTPVARTS
jgi:hypothetical protein